MSDLEALGCVSLLGASVGGAGCMPKTMPKISLPKFNIKGFRF